MKWNEGFAFLKAGSGRRTPRRARAPLRRPKTPRKTSRRPARVREAQNQRPKLQPKKMLETTAGDQIRPAPQKRQKPPIARLRIPRRQMLHRPPRTATTPDEKLRSIPPAAYSGWRRR